MNIGLIGFGSMGRTHAYALSNQKFFYRPPLPDAKIVGVCTAHAETAEEAARLCGAPLAVTEEERLIGDPNVDIIDICTPNACHFETAKKALAAGKAVYCEKPLAVSFAEAEKLAALAEEKGAVARVVFNNRFLPAVRRAKALLDEGRLGRILTFRFAYLHASAADPKKPAGWKQTKEAGGGVLRDLGSHVIDLAVYLLGSFSEVAGRAQIGFPIRAGKDGETWRTDAEEACYLTAALKNGAVGTVEANKLATGCNDDLEFSVYGTEGALRFHLMEPNFLFFYDGKREGGDLGGEKGFTAVECVGRTPAPGGIFPGVKAPVGWLRGHIGSMHAFLDAVAGGEEPGPDFREGAYVQLVTEKALRSAENGGRAETVPDYPTGK